MSREEPVDVIVVGAGPAGAAAAHDLATAGCRVVLLERPGGPGRKPCAGGVTAKAWQRLRFSIEPVIRESVHRLELRRRGGHARLLASANPVVAMTHRPELDVFCRDRARDAGAAYRETELRVLRQDSGGVTVETGAGRLRAHWLIGADGAHSRVRRLVFGGAPPAGAVAIEGLISRDRVARYPDTRFDFGAVRGGYGWLFPKGDHINAGLYVWHRDRARPRRRELSEWTRAALGTATLEQVRGFPLGTWAGARPVARGRVLLAGDAAGQVEALLGEGIYGALYSGQQAAAAVIGGGDAARRYRELLGSWSDEAARMRPLAALFYGMLPLAYGALSHGLGAPLVRTYARGETLGQGKRRWLTWR